LLGRKRRASFEDEEMGNDEPITTFEERLLKREDHSIKRNRTSIKKQFPISKLLGKQHLIKIKTIKPELTI
jgi:hypothetical protein